MHWIAYFILAYLSMGVQLGLARAVQYQGAEPNFMLLAVIFIAVNAPKDESLVACFLLGFMQDLTTQQQLGLFALSYGLVAMFVISTQALVYREHPLTHFSLALAGGLVVAMVLGIHQWIHPPRSIGVLFTSALYTAVVAPVVLWMLQRIRKPFGFQSTRRRGRGW